MVSIVSLLRNLGDSYPSISKRHLRVLLAHLVGHSVEFLMAYPETEVSSEIADQFLIQARQLEAGMPLSRLLGKREFWD